MQFKFFLGDGVSDIIDVIDVSGPKFFSFLNPTAFEDNTAQGGSLNTININGGGFQFNRKHIGSL